MGRTLGIVLALALMLGTAGLTVSAAENTYRLVIEGHQFQPARLEVPADQAFRIEIENRDATPEEFESHDLNIEKIVTGGGKITVRIGPLDPGTYRFVGEFHEDSAKGELIVK